MPETTSTALDRALRSALEVREDAALGRELRDRMPPPDAPRDLSVTDLVALRPAYWRARAPVPLAPIRVSRIELGRRLHRRVSAALETYGPAEVRIRRDGLVGRIDLLADAPVEIKTGSELVPPDDLPRLRPDQLEQLVGYAALVGSPTGRLVTLVPGGAEGPQVQAVEVVGIDLGAARASLVARAGALRSAWSVGNPGDLPRCRWFGRGCEFQEATVCDCTGAEPEEARGLLDQARDLRPRPDLSEAIAERVAAVERPEARIDRFRDLLYPRRAYYDRRSGRRAEVPPLRGPTSPPDLYERVRAAIESGPVAEVAALPTRADEPAEDVAGFRGVPWIERVTRAATRPEASTLLDRSPQYALELAWRCVATGSRRSWLFVGWERATDDRDRCRAFELNVTSPTPFARLWRDRQGAIERAESSGRPDELPSCPGWMAAACPYGTECGCPGTSGRSQR
jgi:hypothetical protein